ncbi:MAG: DUF1178 family protein, partial [Sphingobium sp.]
DLQCSLQGHVFEAWFGSTADYESQRERGLVACPMCGDQQIEKAVMAPRVGTKSNRQGAAHAPVKPGSPGEPSPESVRKLLADIAAKQAEMLPQSRWVGRDFADAARAMHEGRAVEDLIHGQASPEEARALHDDGIAAIPLLVPIVPPEATN